MVIAVAVASWYVRVGYEFSAAVEPEHADIATMLFWALFGIVVAAPAWLPALVPVKHPRSFLAARWIGAIGVIPLGALFGSIVAHQLGVLHGLGDPSHQALLEGTALTLGCVIALVIVVKSLVRREEPAI